MDKETQDRISHQALSLVEKHFMLINEGYLTEAKHQLFHPSGLQRKPLDIYVKAMEQLKPFTIVSISVKRINEIRKICHGSVATIWIDIVADCKLGHRSTDILVWWFPDSEKFLISGRPDHWILEIL